ncbi:MAG: J domain-containing protein [Alphaproteobacteria bacterium]|nr:J domain-containing protein [Alphaproteobacteria bacterium]
MRDPYDVLGVARSASPDEIKSAYRKQAKKCHPDLHRNDPKLAERFKELSQAYAILGDEAQKTKFDSGEIGPDGNPRAPFGFGAGTGRSARRRGRAQGPHHMDFEVGGGPDDLFESFADLFGGMGGRTGRRGRAAGSRGADRKFQIEVDFLDAMGGAKRRLTLPPGRMLDVQIPPGVETGRVIRLKGQGEADPLGGPPGDALIEVTVKPHPQFRREGEDIHVEVPLTLAEAVLGARIQVPTVDGPVSLTVPKGANAGRLLRLKGKGVAKADGGRGDQYVKLVVRLPEQPDEELSRFVEKWAKSHPYEVGR